MSLSTPVSSPSQFTRDLQGIATRELSPPTTTREITSPKNFSLTYNIIIGTEKIDQLKSENLDDDQLAQTLGTKKEEIEFTNINGEGAMILSYENQSKIQETMANNPLLKTMTFNNPTNGTEKNEKEWVKIRQWPIDTDTEHTMLINGLLGWFGKIFPPKSKKNYTTALLKAPSESEAKKLLDKGYIISNGKLLPVVPENSTREEEQKRTVLLVGINKAQSILNRENGRLTEIGLLKSLVNNGYPIQSLKLVQYDEKRIGHSAYVLLKQPIPAKDLPPFLDNTTNTVIKWAEVADYDKICEKCLNWPEHLQTCIRHANNVHRNINSAKIAKRAAEGGSLLLQQLKRQTSQKQAPP